jgi:hypothetical protein
MACSNAILHNHCDIHCQADIPRTRLPPAAVYNIFQVQHNRQSALVSRHLDLHHGSAVQLLIID